MKRFASFRSLCGVLALLGCASSAFAQHMGQRGALRESAARSEEPKLLPFAGHSERSSEASPGTGPDVGVIPPRGERLSLEERRHQ